MSDRPEDHPDDHAADAGRVDPLEAALADALEARAGGPVAVADETPMGLLDEQRLAAIDAEVSGSSGSRRRFQVLGVAAALLVALLVGSVVLTRSDGGTEVQSVGDESTTTAPAPDRDPDPTVTEPVPTSVNTTVPEPITTGDLAGFDPANFTYPSSVCSGLLDSDQGHMPAAPFTLVGGTVLLPYQLADGRTFADSLHVGLDATMLGDVTGDGHDDAILTLRCAFNQSDGVWPSIVIVSDVAGTPTVLGAVIHSGFETTLTETNTETGETSERPRPEDLVWVKAEGGQLLARWNQNGGMGMNLYVDQRETTVTYRWDGTTFVPLSESDVVVIPKDEYVPPPFNLVEDYDFASMELVMDPRLRVGNLDRVACGVIFQGSQPVNAQLVAGAAVVRDDGGNELGTVSTESIEFANLDDDDRLEAMVRFRCTRGSASAITLAIFEPTSGPPDLLWSTTDFAGVTGLDDVVRAEAGVDGKCPLTVTYRSAGAPDSGILRISYRRDFMTFVEDHTGCAS